MMSGVLASSMRIESSLVDDGEIMPALHHVLFVNDHVVAQVIEAELVIGAVGYVGGICGAARLVVQIVRDHADRHPQVAEHLAHPFALKACQIIVDGNDMHALAGQRVQIAGERGDERFAFACSHFGDTALMQHDTAEHLHMKMTLAKHAAHGLAHDGKRLGQQVVQRFAGGQPGAEFFGHTAQLFFRKPAVRVFIRIDFRGDFLKALDFRRVGIAE